MSKKEVKHVDLRGIENPVFLHNLSYKELDVLSEDIRDFIIKTTANYGGHLASNLGSVESTISLCRNFDFLKDKIIFDVGHQCYTYKILTGRPLDGLRTKNGISGFQKMNESPYDHFECGHSSTSISVANGMAIARDLNHEKYDVIAYIGDGSIVNGLSLEGLNLATQEKHKIIIVFNDNDMSISKPVGALSRAFRKVSTSKLYTSSKTFFGKIFGKHFVSFLSNIKNWFKRHLLTINLFDLMGYAVIGPINGHDIKAMDKAFKRAKNLDGSVVIHIKTKKGKGYPYSEDDAEGKWHGVGKFDIETGLPLKQSDSISWSKYYETLLMEAMDNNPDIVTIVPATGVGSALDPIFEKYPDRTIDVGIAEEHACTLAGSLAISGKHPVISIYSTFLQRAYDEIHHDIARMNASVTFLVDRSGLVGGDGETHQGLYDEAFLYSIPNTIITCAASKEDARHLFNESFKHSSPFFIRYPKSDVYDIEDKNHSYAFGKWIIEQEGKDKNTAIITLGPITLKLLEQIKDVTIVNALYQNPLDVEMIKSLIEYKKIIIYDIYGTKEGFPLRVTSLLYENGYNGELIIKSLPNVYVKQATVKEQMEEYGLSVEDIKKIL